MRDFYVYVVDFFLLSYIIGLTLIDEGSDMKLSEKIFDLRKKMGLSQDELAEKLNVSRQSVSRWEVGSASPDAENLKQLSSIFGVSVDYLLNDDSDNDATHSDSKKAETNEPKKQLSFVSLLFLISTVFSSIAAVLFLVIAIDRLSIVFTIAAVVTVLLAALWAFLYTKSKKWNVSEW